PPLARADRSADGLRGVGLSRADPVRVARAGAGAGRVRADGTSRARAARVRVERALRLSRRFFGALLREAALPLRPAGTSRPAHVSRVGPRRRRAGRGPGAPLRGPRQSRGLITALTTARR